MWTWRWVNDADVIRATVPAGAPARLHGRALRHASRARADRPLRRSGPSLRRQTADAATRDAADGRPTSSSASRTGRARAGQVRGDRALQVRRPGALGWRPGSWLVRPGCRACPGPGWAPGGSWRICSSCWRAASCWANSVAWMPWNSPSSQPTSCALATRISPSVGISPSRNGRASIFSSCCRSGRQRLGQLGDRALVDLGQALAARLVERRGADLLEEHLDHRADAHHLGRRRHGVALLDVGVRRPACRRGARARRARSGRAAAGSARIGHEGILASGCRRVASNVRRRSAGYRAEQRHEHLGRRQRAVPADQGERAGVGRVVEADRGERHERDVAEAGGDRGGDRRAEPVLVDDLLPGDDPGEVLVALERAPWPGRRRCRGGRATSGSGPRPTAGRRGRAGRASGSTMLSPTWTWPWSAVTSSTAPGGRTSRMSPTRRSAARSSAS